MRQAASMMSVRSLSKARFLATRSTTTMVAPPTSSALGLSTAIIGAANALGFGVSVATGSHYHLDLLGTGVFAVSAIATRGTELRQQLSAACIGLWSTKLAGFLLYRVLQTHHDG